MSLAARSKPRAPGSRLRFPSQRVACGEDIGRPSPGGHGCAPQWRTGPSLAFPGLHRRLMGRSPRGRGAARNMEDGADGTADGHRGSRHAETSSRPERAPSGMRLRPRRALSAAPPLAPRPPRSCAPRGLAARSRPPGRRAFGDRVFGHWVFGHWAFGGGSGLRPAPAPGRRRRGDPPFGLPSGLTFGPSLALPAPGRGTAAPLRPPARPPVGPGVRPLPPEEAGSCRSTRKFWRSSFPGSNQEALPQLIPTPRICPRRQPGALLPTDRLVSRNPQDFFDDR